MLHILSISIVSRRTRGQASTWETSCEPSIPPPPELPPNDKAPWINIPSSMLGQEWLKLVNSDNLSDVVFRLDTKTFHAHKLVLCTASDVFRRVFGIEAKVKVQSLAKCPGWSKKRLQKITVESINQGAVEGFVAIQNR